MASLTPQALDDFDCNILSKLHKNARIPFAESGRRVRLSTAVTTERNHHRLKGAVSSRAPVRVGLPVRAFVKVIVAGANSPTSPLL